MSVLDASALLAYMFQEPGGDVVGEVIKAACISSVNFAEVLTRIARDGKSPGELASRFSQTNLQVIPFLTDDALTVASLEPKTRRLGLSLGDRACLALGLSRSEPVYTADRVWAELDIGVKVVLIR